MNEHEGIGTEQLDALGIAFREMLIPCLEESSRGRWGLFGVNKSADAQRYLRWEEAEQLQEFAVRIQAILAQSGERNALVDEFLDLCTMIHGANSLGEPRLAREFLRRIARGEVGVQGPEFR